MIHIFRRIRKQLLGDNNSGKYLKYAVGEIFLVVIGILLALQINNWNEYRKARSLEREMLNEIKIGLLQDIKDITYNISAHSKILNSQEILIEWLDSKQPYADTLSYHFAMVNNSTVFVSNESPYETLKQIGIRLITNDTLRNKISDVYDLDFDYYKDHIVLYNDILFKSWKDYNKPYFEATKFLFSGSENRMKPLDIDKIRADNDYRYYIKTISEFNDFYIHKIMNRAKNNAEELVAMIEKEIGKK